jgi:ATPase subunit of ABC transporter with duplicated ATPase domains
MVVVSHDRAFLERVVTEVLEIDERHRTGTRYGGGWTSYLDARSTARRHAEESYAEYQDQRSTLTSRAQREREWAREGVAKAKRAAKDNDKIQRKAKVNTTEQLAARASRTERAMERLDEVEKPWEGWELRLDFAMAPRAGAVVARLTHAVIERGTFRLGPIDLEIGWGERVALLGANGSGKTTLLDALLGRLPLTEGDRWVGPGVVIGELDQRRLAFDDAGGRSLLDVFADRSGLLAKEARTLLAKFGLVAEHVLRPAASLSPGERTRAALALLMAKGTNWLVLDEPTNHLDLPAIEQLEQALATWGGTVLLVTHDRRFLESLHVTRTIEL